MSPSEAPAFEADYFDGRGSARHRVRVTREGGDVRVLGEGVALALPVSALRFRPRVGGLPLSIELPDAGLLVADGAQVSAVLPVPAAASLAQRLERHMGMVWASIAGVAVALFLGWQYGVPWAADKVARVMPVAIESEISEQGMKTLDRFVFHPSDLPIARREALRAPFEEMRRAAGSAATLDFRHGGAIGANALALPGRHIIVTDQLVAAMDDDDLVMAVLAHELGHVEHRHATRNLLQSSLVALGSVLLLGDVSAVSGLAAALPTVLLHTSYSRDFEREADAYAIDLLQRTGRSPRHFAQALGKLEREAQGRKRGDVPSFIATHPSTRERIRTARDATP